MTVIAPRLYRLTQRVAAPGAKRRIRDVLEQWLQDHPSPGRCLDVGCGPDSWLREVGLQPQGVDLDARRVAAFCRNGHGIQALATALPFANDAFDSVWSFGLLHHLADDDARLAVTEMRRVTSPGGCTIVFDAVLPRIPWQRPIASWLRWLDRGPWMRSQQSLEALLTRCGDWERKRLTYSVTGLEGLLCTCRR